MKQILFYGHSCIVVFLEISSDNIISAINATQTDESSFSKYNHSIFFKQ